MKSSKIIIIWLPIVGMFVSCEQFLQIRPDKKLTIPTTTSDLLGLMQDVQTMNYAYAGGLAVVGADVVYLPYENWAGITSVEDRGAYIWEKQPVNALYWSAGYERILNCNTVIDYLDDVIEDPHITKQTLKGIALFYRGFTFFDLVQVFSPSYDVRTADNDLGIVLRLNSDVNIKSKRATVAQTYKQLINDLKTAIPLLPLKAQFPTTPTRAAGYAALARIFLAIEDYSNAYLYADSCLQLYNVLLDYAEIEARPYPFDRFNEEVVFYSQLSGYRVLPESMARVDTILYQSYDQSDLRKTLFFNLNNDGYFSFVGNYSQHSTASKFNGLTTAEVYLIRAESAARAGSIQSALADLNFFRAHRYAPDSNIPETADADQIINLVLTERHKEFLHRGLRWQDIRRLANDIERSVSLKRMFNGELYSLNPAQIKRFAYFIPQEVVERSGIEQND